MFHRFTETRNFFLKRIYSRRDRMATNNGSAENKLHTAAPGDFEIMEIDTARVNTTQRTTQKGATASVDKGEIGQSNIVDGTGRQSSDEIRVKWNEEFGFPFEKNRSRIIRTELSKDGAVTGRDGVYKQEPSFMERPTSNLVFQSLLIPAATPNSDESVLVVLEKVAERLKQYLVKNPDWGQQDEDHCCSSVEDKESICQIENVINTKAENSSSSVLAYETAKASLTEQTEQAKAQGPWPPTEDWAIKLLEMHKDPDVAKIVIEAERERRKEEGMEDGETKTNEKRQKYALVNNTMIEISDELYLTLKYVLEKKRKREEAKEKERPEIKYLYDYFSPGPGVQIIEGEAPLPNAELSYENSCLCIYANAFSAPVLPSERRRRHCRFVQSFVDFARRCRKLCACRKKQSD